MESIEFIQNYEKYIEEIRKVIKPELFRITDELMEIDPHDLVRPDTYFMSETHARGCVWSLFISNQSKHNSNKSLCH